MKTTTYFLLLLFLFLFTFSIKYSPVLAQSESEAVRDIADEKLRTGIEYYILPVVRGKRWWSHTSKQWERLMPARRNSRATRSIRWSPIDIYTS
ncbi:hypothetical protein BVC80_645g57 [Macleaya cordata]|uniref:Uncharacterized protein n=1 Tax=Macleaya cordata TaxID=56857 RepID=A0A200QJW5_MACCD|nr:hypothetical protein BVC80_645g57 [Macleaya cordata]